MSNKNKKIKVQETKAPIEKRNKGIVIGAVVVVVVVAIIAFLVTPHGDAAKEPETVTDSAIEDFSETMEEVFDEDSTAPLDIDFGITGVSDYEPTQYADIEIEDYGTVTVALNEVMAPETVANFVSLVEEGFYDGLTFHRIVDDFMMQGGDPTGTGGGGSEKTIKGEFANNGFANTMSHVAGAISMARSQDNDSASSQFFICDEDSTFLDGNYACFGYVTEGLDIVHDICAEFGEEDKTLPADQQPVITKITIREP